MRARSEKKRSLTHCPSSSYQLERLVDRSATEQDIRSWIDKKQKQVNIMTDIISVKDLVEAYCDGTRALDDISFHVKEGEFHVR